MPEFLVEVYMSRTETVDHGPPPTDIPKAMEELAHEGKPVTLVSSVFVPEEETGFLFFQAQSAEVVREAAERAGLRPERVMEVVRDWMTPTAALPGQFVHKGE
jgi:hypothetical protein